MLRVTLLLISFFLHFSAISVMAEVSDTESVRELLERSGRLDQLRQFPIQALNQVTEQEFLSSPAHSSILNNALAHAYNVDQMESRLVETVGRELNEESTRQALQWYQSPIGEKVTRLEKAAYAPDAQEHMQEFAERLVRHPIPQQRFEQIQRLDKATNSTELGMDLILITALSTTAAVNATLPSSKQIDPSQIQDELSEQRQQMKEALQHQTAGGFLYLYHTLNDREMSQYLEFVESKVGQRFQAAVLSGLKIVLHSAGQDAGQSLAQAMRKIARLEGV